MEDDKVDEGDEDVYKQDLVVPEEPKEVVPEDEHDRAG